MYSFLLAMRLAARAPSAGFLRGFYCNTLPKSLQYENRPRFSQTFSPVFALKKFKNQVKNFGTNFTFSRIYVGKNAVQGLFCKKSLCSMTNEKSCVPLWRPTSWRVAAAGRWTGDEGIYLLSLPENGRDYVRLRSRIRARFSVAWKGSPRAWRPLPRASRDRRYNTLHFALQSGVPKGSPPLESPGLSAPSCHGQNVRDIGQPRKRPQRRRYPTPGYPPPLVCDTLRVSPAPRARDGGRKTRILFPVGQSVSS